MEVNIFPIPLPDFTFTVYRDGAIIAEDLVAPSYFDSTSVGGVVNLVGDQDYCYSKVMTFLSGWHYLHVSFALALLSFIY